MTKTKEREPDWGSFPPEMRRLVETIRQKGSDALDEMQRLLVVQIFRAAAMTAEPRVNFSDKRFKRLTLIIAFGCLLILKRDEHSLLGIYQSLRGFW
jgi:hypothetical protein